MKKWTWRIVIVVLALILLLVACGAFWVITERTSNATAESTKDKQVSKGVVTKAPECLCAQKPAPKKKATRRTGKSKPLVYAKPKPATVQAPVARTRPSVDPVVNPVVTASVGDHILDKVDTGWGKRMAAKPKEEPVVNVVREVVVIQQPAKFVHVIPSNYRTCQFLYGSYRCDNPGYNTYGTSYVQPYAPQPHQPVAVQRYVSAPAIRTAPTATPAIITAPQSIATR